MATQNRATLKSYFNTGDKPTESQFADLIDSMALTTEVVEGTLPQSENFRFVATTVQSSELPPTDLEVIGITPKTESDANSTVIGIVKESANNKEFALMGRFMNGFRAEYTDIQPDGSYTAKMIISGLTNQDGWSESNHLQLLVHNGNTGELKRMSWDAFSMFVDLVSNARKTLKNLSSTDINTAAASTQVVFNLEGYTFEAGEYVQKLFISTGSILGNLSAITSAYITLPGSANTIDMLPYLANGSSTFVIPIAFAQALSSSTGQATLTLGFDAGNGEVNPQNFTGGSFLTIAAITERYSN
jgi:hypothetical protein